MKKYILLITLFFISTSLQSVTNEDNNQKYETISNSELFNNKKNLDSIFSVVTIPFDSTNIFLLGMYHLNQNQPDSAIYYFEELLREESDSLIIGELLNLPRIDGQQVKKYIP